MKKQLKISLSRYASVSFAENLGYNYSNNKKNL